MRRVQEIIARFDHKALAGHEQFHPPGDDGKDQVYRMRMVAFRPPLRVGFDLRVGVPPAPSNPL
jgi:hypothetical protein